MAEREQRPLLRELRAEVGRRLRLAVARIFAFTALSMLPSLAVFVFAERQILGGLSGAVKG